MKKSAIEPTTSDLSHNLVEIASFASIFGAARCAHHGIESALRQDRQRIDHHLVVLVAVKLVWQVEVFLG
jgi:hypothetical protein